MNDQWAKIIADRLRGVALAIGGVACAVMGGAANMMWGVGSDLAALWALALFGLAFVLVLVGVIMAATGKPWVAPNDGQFSSAGLVWNGKQWVKPAPEVTGSGLVVKDGQWVKSEDVKP